jgi:hypothetical protein
MDKINIIDKLQLSIQNTNNSIQNLQKIFYEISQELMNNYEYKINNIKFELTEIEFYYFNEFKHCDIFTHTHILQKDTKNILYVHESWGNYGGIDITFGNGEYYGGILIRGIKINDIFIAGPSKVRTELIQQLKINCNSYKELQIFFNQYPLEIMQKESLNHKTYHSSRINLGKKDNDNYRYALYRFVREDYLNEPKNDIIFKSRDNLKERSLLKAISYSTLGYSSNEKSTLEKIKNNQILQNYIKNFKL